MWPDRVSNPRPLALESDALPPALRYPGTFYGNFHKCDTRFTAGAVQGFSNSPDKHLVNLLWCMNIMQINNIHEFTTPTN